MTGLQALDQLSTSSDTRLRRFGAIVLAILLSYWSFQLLKNYPEGQTPWIFLDNLNLLIHEAGHWIWMPWGEFWSVLGGSLTQVLLPLLILLTFIWQRDLLGSGFGLFWVGNNLINVSYYVADAQTQNLPLLGGDGAIHDWIWILTDLGWLQDASGLALVVKLVGIASILLAMGILMLAILTLRPYKTAV